MPLVLPRVFDGNPLPEASWEAVCAAIEALDARMTSLTPVRATKTSTTSRNTTTVYAADPHLSVTLSDGTWELWTGLLVSSAANAAGDFKQQWSWTGTANMVTLGWGLVDTLASGSSADLMAQAGLGDTSTPAGGVQYGASTSVNGILIISNVVCTGTVVLGIDWAQFASNANNTNVHANSFITARKAVVT